MIYRAMMAACTRDVHQFSDEDQIRFRHRIRRAVPSVYAVCTFRYNLALIRQVSYSHGGSMCSCVCVCVFVCARACVCSLLRIHRFHGWLVIGEPYRSGSSTSLDVKHLKQPYHRAVSSSNWQQLTEKNNEFWLDKFRKSVWCWWTWSWSPPH